ncbi:hypothetical protein IKE86_01050 [Candidatus Saccharibacteria bacterium]|nr:hypothetical protein [Candidatus Saccharibacteria bacterium]
MQTKKNIIFIVFFLLTIGNGKFAISTFGHSIEYIGLGLLLASVIFEIITGKRPIKELTGIIVFGLIMSCGAFLSDISNGTKATIALSTFLLISYPKFSKHFISENALIKTLGDALLFGMITNAIVGVVTGTLGLSIGSNASILKVLFLCGMKIKNYCGGVWLTIYLLYYAYYYRNGTLLKHRLRFILLFLLILLSSSKGACFLAIVFNLYMFFNKTIEFKETREKKFFTFALIVAIILLAAYVYSDVLANVPTYAYRIKGMDKLFNLAINNPAKLLFGFQDIAYANTGLDYVVNMRNYLGWDASVEMAYVNILIKYGLVGFLAYGKIFKDIINKIRLTANKEKSIATCILIIMLLSGFVETYIASVHYVVGPTLFCLINSILNDKGTKNNG